MGLQKDCSLASSGPHTVFLKARWQAQVNARSRYIQLCTILKIGVACISFFYATSVTGILPPSLCSQYTIITSCPRSSVDKPNGHLKSIRYSMQGRTSWKQEVQQVCIVLHNLDLPTNLWFQNPRENKALSFGFLLSEESQHSWSGAVYMYKLSRINSPPFSTPTSILPNQNKGKSWREREGTERHGQMSACTSTASRLWRRLCILQKWHHWGKTSQESASLTSVSVLSKSIMIFLWKYLGMQGHRLKGVCHHSLTWKIGKT